MLNRDNGASIRVVPAIDLLDGHVVRLRQGRYDQVTEYPVDPDRVAATYAEQGATLLHVIDLSAARDGMRPAAHAEAIRRLVGDSGMAVQVGGGIRDERALLEALELGVARVLVGTLAAGQPQLVGRLARDTARVAVAADVREGTVRAAAWLEDTGVAAEAFVRSLTEAGVRDFLVTAIERDGTLSGPDLRLLAEVRAVTDGVLLAAGGFAALEHIAAARDAGCDGAVVGRALYDGSLDLRKALAIAREPA